MSQYASLAERYWETYRPSALRQIPQESRAEFFAAIGTEVEQTIESLTRSNLRSSSREADSPKQAERRAGMARARAEEETLAELVFLPKEPGTEGRTMPSSVAMEPEAETAAE